jgi:hypothetical protein
MNYFQDIQKTVREAMSHAVSDMLNFTDEPSLVFSAEYLFTVNVAKAITTLNFSDGDPYKIFLEKNTKQFARDCLHPIISGDYYKRKPSVFRDDNAVIESQIDRNGRIDVAVYIDEPNNGYLGNQPLCAIELKGFNPSRNVVIKDLKRNIMYFRISGKTGGSVLKFSLFAALHSQKKFGNKNNSNISGKLLEIEKMYNKWIAQVGISSDIKYKVNVFTVSEESVGRVIYGGEENVIDTNARHHFIGVVVSFVPT